MTIEDLKEKISKSREQVSNRIKSRNNSTVEENTESEESADD